MQDLKFGLVDGACLVEYERDNVSQGTESVYEFEDVSLVNNIMNQLHA